MKKILVICTQPIENSTSSMIRCRNILNELAENEEVVCFVPFANNNSIYYDNTAYVNSKLQIRRFGCSNNYTINSETVNKKKNVILSLIYYLYKKIDLFGASILLIKYKNSILESIRSEKYDIIISFSDPKSAHILASQIKKNNKEMYYIQQWGDPLTYDITNKSILPICIKKRIEKQLMKYADKIVYVSPLTMNEQKKFFKAESNKMHFVPTPCEVKKYDTKNKGKIKVGYLGSYNSAARNIYPLYEAACRCPEMEFLFIGDSDVKLEEKENIQIIKRVSQKKLEKYVEEVDILVCLMNKKGSQIPGKLYNYAGTNKEILVIQDGEKGDEITKFFSKYNRYTFAMNNVNQIVKCLRNYLIKGIPKRIAVEDFKANNVANALIITKLN